MSEPPITPPPPIIPPPPVIPPPLAYAQAPFAIESKPQRLAVRSLRALGFLCIIFGLGCGTFAAIAAFTSAGGPVVKNIVGAAVMEFVGLSGIAYLVCAARIRRGSRIAGLVAIVLAAIQEGLALLLLLSTLVRLIYSFRFSPSVTTSAAIFVGVAILIVLAFAQLLYHLFRFLRPIENPPPPALS